MTLEEILALDDEGKKIQLLKQLRRTPQPRVKDLRDAWDPDRHDVMNPSVRKKRRVLISEAETDEDGKIIKPAVYQQEDVNRISLPMEQEIIGIHTAFTVGKDPSMRYSSNGEQEDRLFSVLQSVARDNKLRFQNKRIVRSWFSETEAVEYWYTKDGDGFWGKIAAKIKGMFGNVQPASKLRCTVWSPFRGDTLYPIFDDSGDYVAQGREYTRREVVVDGIRSVRYFQLVTATMVYLWKMTNGMWELQTGENETFAHRFPKLPCIYIHRDEQLCHNIKPMRERLEKLLSDYADCIDYHFFPYLILKGELSGEAGLGSQDERRRTIKLDDEADSYYLTWDQSPESVKLEVNSLFENIYALTDTPRITFDSTKGIGNATSGVAFKYMFFSTILATDNHAEAVGEFLQRRVNFLVSAIGSLCVSLKSASESIDVTAEVVPYTIDNLEEKLNIAAKAKESGLMSRKSAIMFVGMTDRVNEELELIAEDEKSAPEPQED